MTTSVEAFSAAACPVLKRSNTRVKNTYFINPESR
jgi:hypothetical protein